MYKIYKSVCSIYERRVIAFLNNIYIKTIRIENISSRTEFKITIYLFIR